MTPWNRIGSVAAARPVSSGLEAQIEEPPGKLRLRDRATLRPLEVCCSKGNADRGASATEIVSWPDYPDLANRGSIPRRQTLTWRERVIWRGLRSKSSAWGLFPRV